MVFVFAPPQLVVNPLTGYADLEMSLVDWYRVAIAGRPEEVCSGVEVVRVEPDAADVMPRRLVVIRDDGVSDTGLLTGEASIGVSVLAGTRERPDDAKDLARILHALATQIPAPGPTNPFTALVDRNGPYLVPENAPRARAYFTLTLAVAQSAL